MRWYYARLVRWQHIRAAVETSRGLLVAVLRTMPSSWRTSCAPTCTPTGRCPTIPISAGRSPSSPALGRTHWGTGSSSPTSSAPCRASTTRLPSTPSPPGRTACAGLRHVNSSRPPRPRCGRHVWTRTQLQAALKRAGCKRGIAAEADRIRDIFRGKWPTSRRLSRLPGGVELHEEGEHLFAECCRPPRQGGGGRVPSASGRRDPAELPRLGVQLAARILAEIGDDRTRFADARGLKAYAGSSPITRASGEKSRPSEWLRSTRRSRSRRGG
jgi:hypothetical protein